MTTFNQLFDKVENERKARIKKAGKHICVKQLYGTVSRVTGGKNKILKHRVTKYRFYECKFCGKDMK